MSENLQWTKPWKLEVLISNSTSSLCFAMQEAFAEDEWDSFGLNGHHLYSCLEMGNNF